MPLTIVLPTWTVKGPDSGIKTFLTEVVQGLQRVEGINLVLLCESANRSVFEPLCVPGRATIREVSLPGPGSLRPLTEQWTARSIDPSWGDVLLVPSNIGLLSARLPQIVISQGPLSISSIRGLGDIPTGVSVAHRLYFRGLLGPSLRRAAAVIAVTTWIRDQLLLSVPRLDPSNVHVVLEGVRAPASFPPRRYQGPKRILFSSSLWPYKGAGLLVDALVELRHDHPTLDWRCRFVGKDPTGGTARAELDAHITSSGLAELIDVAGNVEHSTIWQEYVDADVLVYPSLLESFGLPPLEAMACGTPVVASNIPSVAEVVGDAALVVDPRDAAAMAGAIAAALTANDVRTALIERGRRRATALSWDATAAGIAAVARNVRG